MRLFTLFVSYGDGGYYCGVYPTPEHLHNVIREIMDDMVININEIPSIETIKQKVSGTLDNFCYEFSDKTWIHVQETSEQLTQVIKDTYKTDEKLVKQAVRNARPREPGKWFRWSVITDCFAVGSTTAIELCQRFGLDPHEQLDGPECKHCALEQTT